MRNERAHAKRASQLDGLTVVVLRGLDVEGVETRRNLGKHAPRDCLFPALTSLARECQCLLSGGRCLVVASSKEAGFAKESKDGSVLHKQPSPKDLVSGRLH